ncbi:beta-lactamase family protein [Bacillus sp. NP157]|nr:beta-lactamase family protein [Bacillus sp. NP157]
MNRSYRAPRKRRPLALAAMALAACCASSAAFATSTALPATPVGSIAGELVQHLNTDNPTQMQQWLSGVLAASLSREDRDDLVANLVKAVGRGEHYDVFDVQTDPRRPGLLELVVRAGHANKLGLFFLMADPSHPGQLGQAGVAPMDDPALYAGWPKQVDSPAAIAPLLHATLEKLVATADFSGCVTVVQAGNTVFNACRGLAERNFAVPIDATTRFHVGSLDKMFTAVAIAQLVEAGKLSWDATLAELVPEYPDQVAARHITVWQLLHHTAGLGDFLVPGYLQHSEAYLEPRDYLGLIAKQPVQAAPGKQWIYSNAGYMLLGRIVENVSGERYEDYVQRHVFTPAGMHDTGFDRLDEVTPKLAVGYYRDGVFASQWKPAWSKLGVKGGPAGGGYATNADLLRFAGALRDGRLVKGATLDKMFADEVPAGPGAYAAGFGDRPSHGDHVRGHAGGIEGTTASLQMVWNAHAAIAITSNEGPSETWMLAEHIADLLASLPPASTPTQTP